MRINFPNEIPKKKSLEYKTTSGGSMEHSFGKFLLALLDSSLCSALRRPFLRACFIIILFFLVLWLTTMPQICSEGIASKIDRNNRSTPAHRWPEERHYRAYCKQEFNGYTCCCGSRCFIWVSSTLILNDNNPWMCCCCFILVYGENVVSHTDYNWLRMTIQFRHFHICSLLMILIHASRSYVQRSIIVRHG